MNIQNGNGVKVLSVLGLIVTTIIWGSAFVVMKNSVNVISPTYLLALRFSIASFALVAVFWKKIKTIRKSDCISGGLLGVFLFLSYLLQTYGLKYTTASKNAFITTLYVILVPFLHWFINRKKPSANNMSAAVLAVVGLALISLEGDFSVNIGDILTLICGFFFAVHIVFIDRYTKKHDPVILTVIQMIGAAVLSWILAPFLEGAQDFSVINGSMVVGLLYLGVFSTMLCFLLQNVGQKYLSPGTSSIILSFEAVFGLGFAVIFLSEPVTFKLILGCVLMFISILLAEFKRKEAPCPDQTSSCS